MSNQELYSLLQRLLSTPKENEFIEFKENNYKPEEIGKRISALSNGAALLGQKYGYLVFGVEDATHKVVGTSFKPTMEKIGNEEVELWLSRMLSPRIDFRIYEFEYQGKKVVLIHIPAAYNKPVDFQNTAWIRVGSITKWLKDYPEKERKLWQPPSSEFEEEYAIRSVSAADVVAYLDTQSVFDLLLKIPYPTTQSGVLAKLISEKLIEKSNGHFHITNLGAILFAKDLSRFDNLARKSVRVVKYKGVGKFVTEKDTVNPMGYGCGFERLMTYLSGLLPSNEVIGLATRQNVLMYPPLALRELVANAIIHQDFRERGTGVLIEIFDNRIEISNPGKPIIEPIRFIDEYQSRNEMLASAMRRMGFCEEKGSGIDKVIQQAEVWQLPAPDFQVKETHTKATLYAHKDFNVMNKAEKVRACYQHAAIMYVTNQRMTNQSLRDRFKVEERNAAVISRIIRDALEENIIKPEDPDSKSRKFVRYLPFWA
jgi:ATP-dependent DNA helicase RecG